MRAVLSGPSVDPYSSKNKQTTQLLQGLAWQHMSFAFREAYAAFPEQYTSDTFCEVYEGPTINPYMTSTTNGYTGLWNGKKACITADTAFLTAPNGPHPDRLTQQNIYNNDFFMAGYVSSGLAFVLAAKQMGFAGVAQAHFTSLDCPGEVASPLDTGCPKFDPFPS